MHAHGFVHRDLKPDVSEHRPTRHQSSTLTNPCLKNILVQQTGPSWWVKIADFGISKRAKADSEAADTYGYTPSFAAPEQRGIFPDHCSHATDIFATGLVAYLLLSNHRAFPEDKGQWLRKFCDPDDNKHEIERLCGPLNNEKVSLDGINFIFMLLKPRPTTRPEARLCLGHSWATPVSPIPADSVISQETPDAANPANLRSFWDALPPFTARWLGQGTAEQNNKLAEQEAKGEQPPGLVRNSSDAASDPWTGKSNAADASRPMKTVREGPQPETLAQSSRRQTGSLSGRTSVVPHDSSDARIPSSCLPQPYETRPANQDRAFFMPMPTQPPNIYWPHATHLPQHRDSGYHRSFSLHISPRPTENYDAWTGAAVELPAIETPSGTQRGNSMAGIMSGSPIDYGQTDPGTYTGNRHPQYTVSPGPPIDSPMPIDHGQTDLGTYTVNRHPQYTVSPRPSIDGTMPDHVLRTPHVQSMQDTPSPRRSSDSQSPDFLPRIARRVRSRVSFNSDTDRYNAGPAAYRANRQLQYAPSSGVSSDSLMPECPPRIDRRVQSMVSVSPKSSAVQWEKRIEVGLSGRCVMALTLSDNGQYGASWCPDGILRVWNPQDGHHRGQFVIKDVRSLLFSPGSNILAVRTEQALELFMMREYPFRLLRRVPINGEHAIEQPFASECLFSRDNQRIAVPCAGRGGIRLVYTADGKVFKKLSTPGASVTSIAISRDLRNLAVGLDDNTVRTWNLQSYTERWTLRHHAWSSAQVTRVAYSDNGLLAASSTSGILKVWDEEGRTVETKPQGCRLLDCAFCPGSDLVVTADDGGCIRFFDSTTAAPHLNHYVQHEEQGPILRVLFSPDGTFGISCGYKTLEVWHTATATVLYRSHSQSNEGCGVKACFGPNPDILAFGFETGVQLLDLGILRTRIPV
jgi:WD40 repeat protein